MAVLWLMAHFVPTKIGSESIVPKNHERYGAVVVGVECTQAELYDEMRTWSDPNVKRRKTMWTGPKDYLTEAEFLAWADSRGEGRDCRRDG